MSKQKNHRPKST